MIVLKLANNNLFIKLINNPRLIKINYINYKKLKLKINAKINSVQHELYYICKYVLIS